MKTISSLTFSLVFLCYPSTHDIRQVVRIRIGTCTYLYATFTQIAFILHAHGKTVLPYTIIIPTLV
jgi:hypothetical protein